MPSLPMSRLQPLDFHAPASELRGHVAIQYTDGRIVVGELLGTGGGRRFRSISTESQDLQSFDVGSQELGDLAILARPSAHAMAAYQLPEGEVLSGYSPAVVMTAMGSIILAVIFLLLGAPAVGLSIGNVVTWVIALTMVVAPIAYAWRRSPGQPHVFRTDGRGIPIDRLLDDQPTKRVLERRVKELKAEYGAMLSDVVLRIEQPALFDAAAPQTRRFTELLLQWDEHREHRNVVELGELAASLAVAFEAAKSHAATVGMDHLPESAREPAATAVKALRLARDKSTSAAERRTALQQATRILQGLRLYYLPTVAETEALVAGKKPLALPGRIES